MGKRSEEVCASRLEQVVSIWCVRCDAQRRILRLKLPGRRPTGRPKRKYLDLVKGDMKLVGVREEDAEDMVDMVLKGLFERKKRRR